MKPTIVVRISPRRWAKATLTDVIGGIPSYTVVRPVFDNSVDAYSAARAERTAARARRAIDVSRTPPHAKGGEHPMKNASVYISGSGQIPAGLAERVQAIGAELQQAGFTVTVSVSDVESPTAEAPASAPADATTGS